MPEHKLSILREAEIELKPIRPILLNRAPERR